MILKHIFLGVAGVPVLDGGEATVRAMIGLGIRVCFGMGGFQHLPFYRALHKHRDEVMHVLVRDERSGAFMADAFSKVSGQAAMCDATVGPGATNLVSGIAESYYGSIPVIALTSDVRSGFAGRGANQECAQDAILAPVCKRTFNVRDGREIPVAMANALRIALSGRPGPVHVNIPEDVFHGTYEFEDAAFSFDLRNNCPLERPAPDPSLIDEAARLLLSASRPVMICGGGCHTSGAWKEVTDLAESVGMPVATTITGKGVIAEDHPLSLGVVGRFSRIANEFVGAADVILVVGSRLGEVSTSRWTVVPDKAKLIHIDIDGDVIGRNYEPDLAIVGDAKACLRNLAEVVKRLGRERKPVDQTAETIRARIRQWRDSVRERVSCETKPLTIPHVLYRLRSQLPASAILVVDGGLATHWSCLYYDVLAGGRYYVPNRGQAGIGYGLPAAIGAKIAAWDKPVVALVGDGGLGVSIMELETAARIGAPVVIVVLDNQCLGYVKALQHATFGGSGFISVDFLDVDYGAVARAMGCRGVRVESSEQLVRELESALSAGEPSLLDVLVTNDPGQMLPGFDPRLSTSHAVAAWTVRKPTFGDSNQVP